MSRRSRTRPAPDWLPRARHWLDDAACGGVPDEVFFGETAAATDLARKYCRRCSVSVECLTAAMEQGERYGVWGGLTPEERRRLSTTAA